jgi:tRNA threonylcarbamoyl adenosine modification protein (Sua5/YciO/YrdC/YwlC family)
MKTEVIRIETAGRHGDASQVDPDAVRAAAEVLQGGGLLIFPTETVYGVGAVATSAEGIRRLREVKQRPDGKPFTLHLAAREDAQRYAGPLPGPARRLIEHAWPGPVTVIVPVGECPEAHEQLDAQQRRRLYHEGTIGMRCPDHPVAAAVLSSVDAPVVAASANRAGRQPPVDADAAIGELDGLVELALDAGASRYGKASTVVRADAHGLTILREGVLDAATVRKLAGRGVLFVCTGNICRSPMAAGLYAARLAQAEGCTTATLAERGLRICSAGTAAVTGIPASEYAVGAMKEMGIDIAAHRSRPLSAADIRQADRIVCMTASHRVAVTELVPEAAGKVLLLADPTGVEDPIGGDLEVYQRCAKRIAEGLDALMESGSL